MYPGVPCVRIALYVGCCVTIPGNSQGGVGAGGGGTHVMHDRSSLQYLQLKHETVQLSK